MNLIFNSCKLRAPAWLLVFSLFGLSACSGPDSTAQVGVDGSTSIKLLPPEFLTIKALDFTTLEPLVTINGLTVNMSANGEEWTGTTTVPVNDDVTLNVQWMETEPVELLLATARKTANAVDRDITLEILDSDYTTEGDAFDADADELSNIAERIQDTDPFDANDPGDQPLPLVKVNASRRTTVIDGTVNDGTNFWNLATYSDLQGQSLRVNNLIVDETGNYIDQGPNYQWAAIHDGTYLTLLVYGKSLGTNGVSGGGALVEASGDSGIDIFQDDSLEIYIDGDLSQLDDYDFVDDMHLMIPLVMGPEGAREANRSDAVLTKRIQRGSNVQTSVVFDPFDESLVEFAACLCTGANERVVWEVRLNMEALNIPVGKTFGFEIQINQDDDGGTRDAKWAWHAPSRTAGQSNSETDRTWIFPSLMGQIQLLSFP